MLKEMRYIIMNFKETLDTHLASMKSKNYEEFISTVNLEHITLIMPGGNFVNDGEKFVEIHKEWFADKDWDIQYKVVKVQESSQMAFGLTEIYYTDLNEKGEKITLEYYLNLVFQKFGENWLLVHDQNTIFQSH